MVAETSKQTQLAPLVASSSSYSRSLLLTLVDANVKYEVNSHCFPKTHSALMIWSTFDKASTNWLFTYLSDEFIRQFSCVIHSITNEPPSTQLNRIVCKLRRRSNRSQTRTFSHPQLFPRALVCLQNKQHKLFSKQPSTCLRSTPKENSKTHLSS